MIIVIASAKGGCGKTTTAVHLAEYLSRKRGMGPVALMDADADNESASFWYGLGQDWKFSLVPNGESVPEGIDTLVVDAGAAPDSDDLADLMDTADLLIIPTAPGALDIRSAVSTSAGFDLDAGDVKLLVTLAPSGRAKAGPEALAAFHRADIPVCPTMIRRRTCLSNAAGMGTTVAAMKGTAAKTAWDEYQKAFRWLLREVV